MGGTLTGVVIYTDTSGATWPFTYTGSVADTGPYTTYRTPPGLPWQLTTSTGGYTLTNVLTSEQMTFDGQGRLQADRDSYGNSNTLSYGADGVTRETNSGDVPWPSRTRMASLPTCRARCGRAAVAPKASTWPTGTRGTNSPASPGGGDDRRGDRDVRVQRDATDERHDAVYAGDAHMDDQL
jgi:hypothetical protein